jgi:membrane protein
MLKFLKQIIKDFARDGCGVRAAALAYYTIFALPPMLILLILVVGLVWDPTDVQVAIETQFSSLIGSEGARAIRDMLARVERPGAGGLVPTILGVGALLFGAVGAFIQLQRAINRAWEVMPDPEQGGIKRFIAKRILSAGMFLAIAFLLIVSLALSAILSAVGTQFTFLPAPVLHLADGLSSFLIMTLLFAAIFKILPDAEVQWRDVWTGAIVTSVLFVVGKVVIGLYLGQSSPGDAYGAASTLAILLVWVYYAGIIVLFGAEFTQHWAERRGRGILPQKGAVKIELRHIAPGQP